MDNTKSEIKQTTWMGVPVTVQALHRLSVTAGHLHITATTPDPGEIETITATLLDLADVLRPGVQARVESSGGGDA